MVVRSVVEPGVDVDMRRDREGAGATPHGHEEWQQCLAGDENEQGEQSDASPACSEPAAAHPSSPTHQHVASGATIDRIVGQVTPELRQGALNGFA
jgi:hypothetical protein